MIDSGGSWPQDWLRRKVLWVEGDKRERCVTWYACQKFLVSFVYVAEVSSCTHYGGSLEGQMGKPCWMWLSH